MKNVTVKNFLTSKATQIRLAAKLRSHFVGFVVMKIVLGNFQINAYLRNGRVLSVQLDLEGVKRFLGCPKELYGQMMAELMELYNGFVGKGNPVIIELAKSQMASSHGIMTFAAAHGSETWSHFIVERKTDVFAIVRGYFKDGRLLSFMTSMENIIAFAGVPVAMRGVAFSQLLRECK